VGADTPFRIARDHPDDAHRPRTPSLAGRTVTDSWVYLLSGGENIADPSQALGKMTVEKDVILTDTLLSAFTSAEDVHEVNLAIKAAFTDNDHEDEDDADDEDADHDGAGVR